MTTIFFELSQTQQVKITVYDLAGRQVALLADQQYTMGEHTEKWNGYNDAGLPVASGVYFIRMDSEDGVEFGKVILSK